MITHLNTHTHTHKHAHTHTHTHARTTSPQECGCGSARYLLRKRNLDLRKIVRNLWKRAHLPQKRASCLTKRSLYVRKRAQYLLKEPHVSLHKGALYFHKRVTFFLRKWDLCPSSRVCGGGVRCVFVMTRTRVWLESFLFTTWPTCHICVSCRLTRDTCESCRKSAYMHYIKMHYTIHALLHTCTISIMNLQHDPHVTHVGRIWHVGHVTDTHTWMTSYLHYYIHALYQYWICDLTRMSHTRIVGDMWVMSQIHIHGWHHTCIVTYMHYNNNEFVTWPHVTHQSRMWHVGHVIDTHA